MLQTTPYTYPLIIILFFEAVILLYLRGTGFFRQKKWARPLLFLLIETMAWMLFNLLGLSFVNIDLKLYFIIAFYIVNLAIPLTWLAFALYYTGNERFINKRNIILVSLIPLASAILALTTKYNNLVIERYDVIFYRDYSAINNVWYGTWESWVQVPYSFIMVAFSIFLVIRLAVKTDYFYKWQAVLFIALQVIPLAIGIVYLQGINPFPHLEYSPIVLSIGILATIALLMRSRYSELIVLARGNIMENVENGIIVLDSNDKVLDINRKAVEILQDHRLSILTRDINDVLDIEKMTSQGKKRTIEIERKNKKYIYDLKLSDVKSIDDKTIGKVIVLHDITPERNAIRRLDRLNKILTCLSEVNRLIVREKDKDKMLDDICESLIKNRGYNSVLIVLTGKDNRKRPALYQCGIKEDLGKLRRTISGSKLLSCIKKVLKDRKTHVIEKPGRDCPGCEFSEIYGKSGAIIAPLASGNKDFGAIIASVPEEYIDDSEELAIFEEITDDIAYALRTIEQEEALLSIERFNSEILSNSPNPVSVLNPDRSIRYVNPAFEKITGFLRHELVGRKPPYPYWPENKTDYISKELDKYFKKDFNDLEYHFKHKNGKGFWVEISGRSVLDDNGEFLYMLQNWVDITESKKALRKIKSSQKALNKSYEMLRKTTDDIIMTLSAVIESKDQYTADHQKRVSKLSVSIAEKMGFDKDRLELIRVASLLHDIGKINIPASILTKPGKINDLEYELIKTHPQNGYDITKGIDFPWPIKDLVLQHHERLDGSGYPQGLTGEQIMVEAKILAVADTVEAMSSHRPYRPSLGIDKALKEIATGRGMLFDEKVVDACLELFRKDKFEF